MKYRRLGRTNLHVSVIGVGTWQYGGEWGVTFEQSEVDAIFDRAQTLGINLIDTAECYGDHLSEKLIGQSLKNLGHPRDQWIIATKFGHHFHEPFKRTDKFDVASVTRQLDESLKALQTDYVDLYQFHSGLDEHFDQDDLWDTLNRAVEAGKVRHLGVSISKKRDRYQADQTKRVGGGALQVVYNWIERQPETNGMFEAALRDDLGVLARVPLCSGYLSGKYNPDSTFAANDVREVWQADHRRDFLLKAEEAKKEVPPGVNMAQWALAWCLQHDAVATVIPGCKNVEQVESNAAAAELDMVKADHPLAVASAPGDE